MSESVVLQGTFEIEEIDQMADALDRVRELGVTNRDIEVISSMPFSPTLIGLPPIRTGMGTVALIGGALGLLTGLFFTVGTPYLYTVAVGGQPKIPWPPSFILLFECTMAGIMWVTFLGLFWLTDMPTLKPQHYDPALSDGGVGLFVRVSAEQEEPVRAALVNGGARDVQVSERRSL
jgi:hypothetical protein